MEKQQENKTVARKVGVNLIERSIVLSHTGKYLMGCVEGSIRVWNASTGHIARNIENAHQNTAVMCLSLHPSQPDLLYSAGGDGRLNLWNYDTGILLKSIILDENLCITFLKISHAKPDEDFFFIACKRSGEERKQPAVSRIFHFNAKYKMLRKVAKAKSCTGFDLSKCGRFIALASSRHLYLIDVEKSKSKNDSTCEMFSHVHTRTISCCRIDPQGEYICFGDEQGKLMKIYCFPPKQGSLKDVSNPTVTEYHWHAHEVADMQFSEQGNFMISGGEEAVMVKWRVETNESAFLPRLPAAIRKVGMSADESKYFAATKSNSIVVISAMDFQVCCTIEGLEIAAFKSEEAVMLSCHPITNHVYLSGGIPGHLQVYDHCHDRVVSSIQISNQNIVSRISQEEIKFFRLIKCEFSSSGAWMITCEEREKWENKLKFWCFDEATQQYKLKTVVNNPHSKEIRSLAVYEGRNGRLLAATSGNDHLVKIWGCTNNAWFAMKTLAYKGGPATSCSFSSDGSLLAASFGRFIALYNGFNFKLIQVLVNDSPRSIKQISFLNNSPFLICSSTDRLNVWNLLSLSLHWGYKLKVKKMAVSKSSSIFAVAAECEEGGLLKKCLIFDGNSAVPSFMWDNKQKSFKDLCFDKNDDLLFADELNNLILLTDKAMPVELPELHTAASAGMANIFMVPEAKKIQESTSFTINQDGFKKFSNIPTHVLPSISSTFTSFMATLKKPAVKKTIQKESIVEEENEVSAEKNQSIALNLSEIQSIISTL